MEEKKVVIKRNVIGVGELDLTSSSVDKRYLGELIEDLPHNCFFNKVLCGAGGTHLALTNNENYIILSPTTELIKSKQSVEHSLPHKALFVYGNKKHTEIKDYLMWLNRDKSRVGKIMVTYHSLPKVLSCMEEMQSDGFIDDGHNSYSPLWWRLLVDEAHMLTEGDDKDFMHNVIKDILFEYKRFKSHCFMTATPYPRECFPEQLSNIEIVVAKWNDSMMKRVLVKAQHIERKFNDYVLKIAIDHIQGNIEGNAYFFYNSVEEILKVVKKLIKGKLITLDEIRIICADSNDSYVKKVLGNGAKIKSASDTPHKINFLTSKCFEGIDIWDIDGRTYVCADGVKRHTRVEIHTKLPQIVNRIRDSQYSDEVSLLYSKSFIGSGMDKEAYLAMAKDEYDFKCAEIKVLYDNYEKFLEKFGEKRAEETIKVKMVELSTSEYVTTGVDGRLCGNPNYAKRTLALWECANVTYSTVKRDDNLATTTLNTPLIEIMNEENIITHFNLPTGLDKVRCTGKQAIYSDICRDMLKAMELGDEKALDECCNYDETFKVFVDVYQKGKVSVQELEDVLKKNRYTKRKLVNVVSDYQKMICETHFSDNFHDVGLGCKVSKRDVLLCFVVGKEYGNHEIKTKLQNLYIQKGEMSKAVATDLRKWFIVKKIRNQKIGHGFRVLGVKE